RARQSLGGEQLSAAGQPSGRRQSGPLSTASELLSRPDRPNRGRYDRNARDENDEDTIRSSDSLDSASVLRVGPSQDPQANLPGSTFLISFIPLAVVWNQTLMLP